jgi:aminoglycoside 3-N-acetyltransferase
MFTRDALAADFRALGLTPGGIVMLHASVRAVGEVLGGPDQIHLALGDALGPDGTVMMYASCPAHMDEVGRGELSADEEAAILAGLPTFDPATARAARDNGYLVECFRTWPGTRWTPHPTRFVARGGRAAWLVDGPQPWDWAMGAGSALERLLEAEGQIVLLGSDLDQVTFLHYAEHVADFPDKRIVRFRTPMLVDGVRVWRESAEVDSGYGAHAHWPDRLFGRIVRATLAAGVGVQVGTVGRATTLRLDARALHAVAVRAMEAIARDASAADRLLPPDPPDAPVLPAP